MRQEPQAGFDDATMMAAYGSRAQQLAALPEVPVAPPALPPALLELIGLIHDGMMTVPEVPAVLAGSFPGALPVVVFGAVVPDQGLGHTSGGNVDFEIVPLGEGPTPLSLHDQDLFGSADILPADGGELTLPALFRGFQLDLFGDDAPASLPGLEVTIDVLPDPLVPPTLEPGRVTMFEGHSEIELYPELAQALVDEDGRLVVDGDGDDLVILGETWMAIDEPADAEGYVYFVESGTGLSVGIRGAEVLLV